eukprot:5278951-Pleurochrysis_carterae.AAC.1
MRTCADARAHIFCFALTRESTPRVLTCPRAHSLACTFASACTRTHACSRTCSDARAFEHAHAPEHAPASRVSRSQRSGHTPSAWLFARLPPRTRTLGLLKHSGERAHTHARTRSQQSRRRHARRQQITPSRLMQVGACLGAARVPWRRALSFEAAVS